MRAAAAPRDMPQQVEKRLPRATDAHEQTAPPLPGGKRRDRLRAKGTRAVVIAETQRSPVHGRANLHVRGAPDAETHSTVDPHHTNISESCAASDCNRWLDSSQRSNGRSLKNSRISP